MADDETPELEDRVERLETGQGKILSKLDELLGTGSKAHAAAEEHEEKRLDRPSSVADQVRAELDRAEAEKAAAAEKEAEKSERKTLAERVAALTEKQPESPQPRRERAMWGKRGKR